MGVIAFVMIELKLAIAFVMIELKLAIAFVVIELKQAIALGDDRIKTGDRTW